MTPKIFLIALTTEGDDNITFDFQEFGVDYFAHPNLVNVFEFTQNDETGLFNAAVQDFQVKTLPTVIFTHVLQEEPLKLIPIVRFENGITYDGLVKTFNDIISGTIPIPPEGGQGVVSDATGEVKGPASDGTGGIGGGLGFGFKLFCWGLAGLAGFALVKKLASVEIDEEEEIEEAEIIK